MTIIYPDKVTASCGNILIDFGKDAYGRLEVDLTGQGGETVELAIGEVLKDGRLNRDPGGYRCFKKQDITLKPGTHTYAFDIPLHRAPEPSLPKCYPPESAGGEIAPFRYAEINGYEGTFDARQLAVFAPFNDDAAMFECSDEWLNRVWAFCKYSIKVTTPFGKYVDGERERLPYEGDAYINQLGHFCCDADYTIARNTIDHLLVYPTWPTEWHLLMPLIVRDYLLYSGDADSARRWYPVLKERTLRHHAGDDFLIRPQNGIRDIVDWPMGERDDYEFGDVNLVPNCYHYRSLLAMAELGEDGSYRQRAAQIKESIRRTMLKGGYFVDNPGSDHVSLHGTVFALWSGVAEETEAPALTEVLRKKGMSCSVYVAQFLLETCYAWNLNDHARDLMTGNGLRSWRNMLDKGATITMEAWDDSLKPNQDWNHAWGAAPANIITRELCGIKPVAPGLDVFRVDPRPGELVSFKVRQPTRHGAIELEYDNSGYRLTVPEGSRALYGDKAYGPGSHKL